MSRQLIYILSFIVIICFATCRKDRFEDAENRDYGFGFYPAKSGGYKLYEGVQIVFNPFFNTTDTTLFLLREEYDTFFEDNLGRQALRIKHYTKHPDSAVWENVKVLYDVNEPGLIERVKDNVRVVKLSFPISDEIFWDMNIFNDQDEVIVFYNQLFTAFETNGLKFDSTITVTMTPEINPFVNKSFKEVFAKNVGMIFSEYSNVELQNNKFAGTKLKLTLINYAD